MPLFSRKKSEPISPTGAAVRDRLNAVEDALGLGPKGDFVESWGKRFAKLPAGDTIEVFRRYCECINCSAGLVDLYERTAHSVPGDMIVSENPELLMDIIQQNDQEMLKILHCIDLWHIAAKQSPRQSTNDLDEAYLAGMFWSISHMRADYLNSNGWMLLLLGEIESGQGASRRAALFESFRSEFRQQLEDAISSVYATYPNQMPLFQFDANAWEVLGFPDD